MSKSARRDDELYSSDALNSGWPPFGEQEEMHSIRESDHGRRNHFLAGDIERLSIMLLGNSLDTSRYPMRTLCQALFPDDCAEEGSNHDQGEREEMVTSGQVTRHPLLSTPQHFHTQPPIFLSSQLRGPLVFQLKDIGEQGYIYQECDRIIHWKFQIENLYQTEVNSTIIKTISSPSTLTPNPFSKPVFFRLYLNSDGARYKPQTTSFFVMTTQGSRHQEGQVSVTLHNSHFRSIQLVRECDISITGHRDIGVEVVCGCGDFVTMDILRQLAKAGMVCIDIRLI